MRNLKPETFIKTARSSVSYNDKLKAKFHRQAENILRQLAFHLGLTEADFELRHNKAGIAVSGEITLHNDCLYVCFSQTDVHGLDFYWRTCDGRKDYTGHRNQWEQWQSLLCLETLAEKMLAEVKKKFTQGEGDRFAALFKPKEPLYQDEQWLDPIVA